MTGCSKVKSNRWHRDTRRTPPQPQPPLLLLLRTRTRPLDPRQQLTRPPQLLTAPLPQKRKKRKSARYSHQLLPVRPSSSPFSEFHRNCLHPPSLSLFAGILSGALSPFFFLLPLFFFFIYPPSFRSSLHPTSPDDLPQKERHLLSGTPAVSPP